MLREATLLKTSIQSFSGSLEKTPFCFSKLNRTVYNSIIIECYLKLGRFRNYLLPLMSSFRIFIFVTCVEKTTNCWITRILRIEAKFAIYFQMALIFWEFKISLWKVDYRRRTDRCRVCFTWVCNKGPIFIVLFMIFPIF
jgi:hypothetical protein